MNYLTDYINIDNALQQLGAEIDASEAHGTLCGLMCAEKTLQASDWFSYIAPAPDDENNLAKEAQNVLTQLHQLTAQQLNDPNCGFQLLLPQDTEPLEQRIASLSEWCQGFLAGLSMGGVRDLKTLPTDAEEVTLYLLEIARAQYGYYLEDSEDDESSLEELIEFVRVGVMLVNEEMNPTKTSASTTNTTLH